jgi:hypothetical protein
MIRIVVPSVTVRRQLAGSIAPVDIVNVVAVKIVVVVDIDVAAMPIAIAPVTTPVSGTPGNRRAEREPHSRIIARIIVGIIRISRCRRAVDHGWIVGWHVHRLAAGRLNVYDLFPTVLGFCLHHLLLTGFQGPFALRFPSHPLHRIHHVRLLGEKRIPEISRPLDIAGHSLQSFRNSSERLHAWIPRLFRDCIFQRFVLEILVLVHPLLKLDNFERIS